MTRLDEAKAILEAFGFDRQRSNDRSARTLLALTRIDDSKEWSEASNPLIGVRAILDWSRERLNFPVAENTRETYRRQTLHQFVEVGFVIYNFDDPARTTNSSLNNYKVNDEALAVIQAYGTPDFQLRLDDYLVNADTLVQRYQAARDLTRIPVALPDGVELTLGAGGQNILIKQMIDDFCGYFVEQPEVLYIGDADQKLVLFEEDRLADLGVVGIDTHGKLPDLVVYSAPRNWLFLMEAASSHGPVDGKRHGELSHLFAGSNAGLVYVSCFPDRATMRRFLPDLAWETEAWCASDPTHLIHLNGSRFLGPYVPIPEPGS